MTSTACPRFVRIAFIAVLKAWRANDISWQTAMSRLGGLGFSAEAAASILAEN